MVNLLQALAIPYLSFFLFSHCFFIAQGVYAQEDANTNTTATTTMPLNVTQDMINLLSDISTDNQGQISKSENVRNGTILTTDPNKEEHTESANNEVILKPSQSIFLEDKSIPAGSFMHLYDISPFAISEAQVTAKLPCDEDNLTDINILVGKMPYFESIPLEFIPQFSEIGDACMYRTNVSNSTSPISEIGMLNNSTEEIDLGPATYVVVAVANLTNLQ